MTDNGNRGPSDSFRRSGKRRREPPIIDAAATEVPVEPPEPTAATAATGQDGMPVETEAKAGPDDASTAAGNSTAIDASRPAPASADAPPAAERDDASVRSGSDEPVLFGNALRDPSHRTAAADPTVPVTDGESSVAASDPTRATMRGPEPLDAVAVEPVAPTAADDSPSSPARDAAGPGMPPPPLRASALAGVLGAAAVVLLGIIGWLVYSGGQRGGDLASTVADLKTRVATLEARPDPAALQTQIAALGKRVGAADSDRAALGKQVAALSARLDGATSTAQSPGTGSPVPVAGGSASATKPSDTAPGQAPSGPAIATAAAVAVLAAKVEGIDSRVAALMTEQTGTAKAVAALPKPVAPDFGPVNAKVTALGNQVTTVDGKINGSDARLNGFDGKINAIDAKVNGFDSKMNGLDVRLNGLDAKIDDGTAQTAKFQSTLTNLPKVDLGPLRAATAALDARVVKVEGQLAAPKDGARVTEARAVGNADETKATPIAVVGQAIERAIAAGRPYGPEVGALKALGADPALISRLGPASAGGAPSVDALKTQWGTTRGKVLATVKPIAPAAGNAFNRLLGSATSIVQVHRVGAVAGDDTDALVSQIDAALDSDDIAGALAAWTKLPDAAKTASGEWADAARSRVEATGAARDLVGGAIATLGGMRN